MVAKSRAATNLLDEASIMGAISIQPKNNRATSGTSPADGKANPVFNWGVLGLAHTPDVTG